MHHLKHHVLKEVLHLQELQSCWNLNSCQSCMSNRVEWGNGGLSRVISDYIRMYMVV